MGHSQLECPISDSRWPMKLIPALPFLMLPFVANAQATPVKQTGAATDKAAERALAELEKRESGILGVAALDSASGRRIDYRAQERFAMCSTFKLLLAGAVLKKVDNGEERLERVLAYTRSQIVPHSPVTLPALNKGLSVEALCEAAMKQSDNTAANLLLKTIGGPAGLTRFARSMGDGTTRLDRIEIALNEAAPGDPRDTTSPSAMLASAQKLLSGSFLKPDSRKKLEGWMMACQTGGARLKAGFPKDWQIGDKTGSGAYGTTNDVAIIYPPGRPPIFIAAYYTGTRKKTLPELEAVLAQTGKIIFEAFSKQP